MAKNADLWKDDEFLLGFRFSRAQTSEKRFSLTSLMEFWDIRRRDV